MADRSIPQQQLSVLQAILKEISGCSSALVNAQLKKILDELREQTAVSVLGLAENYKQTALLSQILDALTSPQPTTGSIAVTFSGDSMANALVFTVGQTSQASIQPLAADGVTPSGGAVSAVSYTFSDPSATVVLNADGLTATCTAVAASTGPVSGSAACTVTDTDGAVSTWNQAFTIQTNGVVPPSQLTQSIAVNFSTPA